MGRAFNRWLGDIEEHRFQARSEQHLLTRQSKEMKEMSARAVVNFIGIGFADTELLTELLKSRIVPQVPSPSAGVYR